MADPARDFQPIGQAPSRRRPHMSQHGYDLLLLVTVRHILAIS
jgi:hypothetical protein